MFLLSGVLFVLIIQSIDYMIPVNFVGVITNDNFIFNFSDCMYDNRTCYGLAWDYREEGQTAKKILIQKNITKGQTIETCNHEVLHQLLCMDLQQEEGIVEYLENKVKFSICDLIVEEALKRGK